MLLFAYDVLRHLREKLLPAAPAGQWPGPLAGEFRDRLDEFPFVPAKAVLDDPFAHLMRPARQ